MTETLWVRSHVERLLQDEWNVCRVVPDDDGDYPFRSGTASCYVSLAEGGAEAPMVRVWAYAALGIKSTAAVLRELNEIQGHCLSASVCWLNGRVLVSQTLSPVGLTQPVLAQALRSVSGVADDIGLLLAGMFGGTTPYPAETSETEEAV